MGAKHRLWILIVGVGLLLAGGAMAAEPANAKSTGPTPEQRHKGAEIHRAMAQCLDSDKTIQQCRAQMQSSCVGAMGVPPCRQMGMMGAMRRGGLLGGGKMGGGMMGGRKTGGGMMGGGKQPKGGTSE